MTEDTYVCSTNNWPGTLATVKNINDLLDYRLVQPRSKFKNFRNFSSKQFSVTPAFARGLYCPTRDIWIERNKTCTHFVLLLT